ncbi:Integral membrane protein SYS1-related protein [Venturia nashicola]|uniref:Integral membrane protein SYS1-related protein n=1 Tax=Venturia nashicola TaxID=86259 RepID=A0A4Z1NSY4_9PEZI|nr:Integral membrane protein SYS1-related protein [Venturia nashicola]
MPRPHRPRRPGALADLNPLRIFTQIILLQVSYYVGAAILIVFTALVAGKELRLDLLLSWRTLRGDTTVGWMLGLVWILNSLICAIAILLLVARSKMVLDFALTIHLIQLIVTSLYSHEVPRNLFWWATQGASAALMTGVGVWACQWRELKPINFGGHGRSTAGPSSSQVAENSTEEEEGVEYTRGRGRGRGRDGAGNYEMVGMDSQDNNA